ncbi:MAG: hypothetical protein HC924_10410 [Synechococcaceae cyanobacterium SM2_3_2]|nr:hypothetical protein [Synechococcaceae cyanobacterium SM2_3_2]
MVRGLQGISDQRLVQTFQSDPSVARSCVALYCRYIDPVDRLWQDWAGSPPSARIWHELWHHLFTHLLSPPPSPGSDFPHAEAISCPHSVADWMQEQVQAWLHSGIPEHVAAVADAPEQRKREQELAGISPVLTWYVKAALNRLDPLARFVLLLWDRFGWTKEQIAAQLQQEGFLIQPEAVVDVVAQARFACFEQIPLDVRALYLASKP